MAFAGEVAWITGASSGIGAALAREVSARGGHVVLSGRNRDALDALAATLGGESLVLPFEVTDRAAAADAADAAWDWAAARSGGIGMLVNNAGISQRSLAVDTAMAVYDRIIDVDLMAPIALTQALLTRMVARGAGRIVMISSVAGKVGVPMRTAYCAAKFGLIGYADALRSETAQAGISVHVVTPGSVRPDGSRNARTADAVAAQMLDAIAAGTREIIIATGIEQAMAEMRRTPDALMDQVAALAVGYADRMAEKA